MPKCARFSMATRISHESLAKCALGSARWAGPLRVSYYVLSEHGSAVTMGASGLRSSCPSRGGRTLRADWCALL